MRNFGGDAYHGHTHESNAYDVERILSKYFDVKLIGNLYFPISFFRIVECKTKNKIKKAPSGAFLLHYLMFLS